MLRSLSVQVRRQVRQAAKANKGVRCISSASSTKLFELDSAQHNAEPLVAKCTRTFQTRTFFTTARVCADLKVFACPGLPESISDGGIKYLKKLGDSVAVDETVCEIETQKTALPVRSDVAGVLTEWLVEDGATITPGTALFAISVGASAGTAPVKAAPAPAAAAAPAQPTPAAAPAAKPAPTPAAPVSTQFPPPKPLAAQAAPKAAPPPPPPIAAAAKPAGADSKSEGPTRTESRVRMTRMRQTIANRLKEAQNNYAMLTTFNEIDMSAVFELRKRYAEAFAKKHGVKLGFMSPFIVGAAAALREMPVINAVIDGNEIVYRDYVDLGVAVATPRGLVVPVLRNADRLSLADAEKALGELGERARKDAITLEDMDGGTFTISNGGVFGSMFGTPIINPPQSAILGMHAVVERPVVVRDPGQPASAPGRIEARPIMYVALTYDHRLIDGREAVTFLRRIKAAVEDPRLLLLGLSV